MPIDLAKPRILAFAVGKRKYTLTVAPIPKKAWLRYFGGIVNTQELAEGGVSSTYDSTGARLELLEGSLLDATGYTKEGESITAIDDWKSKLPMAHRRAAADLLVKVEVIEPNDEAELPALGSEVVLLKAAWTAGEDGRMQELHGLMHVFRSPTADHQKRYSRAMSRSIVVGGSRTGQTRWLGAQDVLIEIYDELIESVGGYEADGVLLTGSMPGDKSIRYWMDGYHKVAAATALFTPVEVAGA